MDNEALLYHLCAQTNHLCYLTAKYSLSM